MILKNSPLGLSTLQQRQSDLDAYRETLRAALRDHLAAGATAKTITVGGKSFTREQLQAMITR